MKPMTALGRIRELNKKWNKTVTFQFGSHPIIDFKKELIERTQNLQFVLKAFMTLRHVCIHEIKNYLDAEAILKVNAFLAKYSLDKYFEERMKNDKGN